MGVVAIVVYFLSASTFTTSFSGYDLVFFSNPLAPRVLLTSKDGRRFPRVGTTEFTFCLYANIRKQPSTELLTLVSFSSRDSGQKNEILFEIDVKKNYSALTISGKSGVFAFVPPLDQWVHVCVSWKSSGGLANLYMDGGKKGINSKGVCKGCNLGGNGYFVLGQDQDSYDGGYEAKSGFQGRITEFYLWNRILTTQEIEDVRNCKSDGAHGQIVNWKNSTWNFYDQILFLPSSSSCGTCVPKKRCEIQSMTSFMDLKRFSTKRDYFSAQANVAIPKLENMSICAWVFISTSKECLKYVDTIRGPGTHADFSFHICSFDNNKYGITSGYLFEIVRHGRWHPYIDLPNDEWRHVCFTRNWKIDEKKLYVNGALKAQRTFFSVGEVTESGFYRLFQHQDEPLDEKEPTKGFRSKITDFNLWDRVISEDEVNKVYCGEAAGNLINKNTTWSKPVGGNFTANGRYD